MTIQMASGERAVVDYFARAPIAGRPDLYKLTADFAASRVGFSGVVDDANAYGALSVATPGMVRGMSVALERFGTLGLAETVGPAIRFAVSASMMSVSKMSRPLIWPPGRSSSSRSMSSLACPIAFPISTSI